MDGNAARKDAYSSRRVLQMGVGQKVYFLIDVFGTASIDQACTVAEQRVNYEAWAKSVK
jgi:hypothetical protein